MWKVCGLKIWTYGRKNSYLNIRETLFLKKCSRKKENKMTKPKKKTQKLKNGRIFIKMVKFIRNSENAHKYVSIFVQISHILLRIKNSIGRKRVEKFAFFRGGLKEFLWKTQKREKTKKNFIIVKKNFIKPLAILKTICYTIHRLKKSHTCMQERGNQDGISRIY